MSNRRYQGPYRGLPPQAGSRRANRLAYKDEIQEYEYGFNQHRHKPQRGRGNSHKRDSNAQRQEDDREISDELITSIRKTQMIVGLSICITTRGIGLATAMLFRKLYSFMYCINDVPDVGTIYQFYRVYLACLECKLILNERKQTTYLPETFVDNVRRVDCMPGMVSRIINSVGNVNVNGRLYVPKIAADRTTDDGLFLPDPGQVTLGNLRRTVVALADARTPLEARRSFYRNNPIPGCIWRGAPDDPFLENADEIIPEDYNVDTDLTNDVSITRAKLSFLERKTSAFVTRDTDYESDGSKSILACNEMENLRVMDRNVGEDLAHYYLRLDVEGNVSKFENIVKLSPSEQLNAAIILCGEHPRSFQAMYPAYTIRDFTVCVECSQLDYKFASQYLYRV